MRSLIQEPLANNDRSTRSITRRRALQLRQRKVDHRGLLNLLQRILLLELRIRVPLTVLVADPRNLCEIASFGTLLLHVLFAGVGEVLRVGWRLVDSAGFGHHAHAETHGGWSVGIDGFDGAGLHLLEADYEDAVYCSVFDEGPGEMESCGTGCTGVVRVVDWYTVLSSALDRLV